MTKANRRTHRFAIVLDKQVISAPVIREPILGGSGEIEGRLHRPDGANDLAVLLRAGALPAPLKSSKSARSAPNWARIRSRRAATPPSRACILVALFMILRYGCSGCSPTSR